MQLSKPGHQASARFVSAIKMSGTLDGRKE
jgi:hypothetical protein